MARAWIDGLGGHWGRVAFTSTDLQRAGYIVVELHTGDTDPWTGRMVSVLHISGEELTNCPESWLTREECWWGDPHPIWRL